MLSNNEEYDDDEEEGKAPTTPAESSLQRQRQQIITKSTTTNRILSSSSSSDCSSDHNISCRLTKWWPFIILGCILFVIAIATMYVEADYLREFSTTSFVPSSTSATSAVVVPSSTTTTTTTPTTLCQLGQQNGSSLDYEIYTQVHKATFPASVAGQWVYEPNQAYIPTPQHLQCLDQERQGNCHDPEAWKKSSDKAKKTRHNSLLKNGISNSIGILNASDPWVWHSNNNLCNYYNVIPYRNDEHDQYRKRIGSILSNRRIILVGDSLTRQWSQVMRCEIMHILGKSEEEAKQIVPYVKMHKGFNGDLSQIRYQGPFRTATEHDYVVFNFGHHVGALLGNDTIWPSKYAKVLTDALDVDFGNIPNNHIFFRTTSVRHFIRGKGDWNTNSSKVGGSEPNMHAIWNMYGGDSPEQPQQNLIVFDTILPKFKILDISPMMLARGDASFDGEHMCLPGPMTYWSRMLYYQIESDTKEVSPATTNSTTTGASSTESLKTSSSPTLPNTTSTTAAMP